MSQKNEAQKNKPTHQIPLRNIRASIWRNESEQGIHYNVTFKRSYRTDDGWKRSDSFSADDLLRLQKCADLAHDWIISNQGNTEEEETPSASSQPDGQY